MLADQRSEAADVRVPKSRESGLKREKGEQKREKNEGALKSSRGGRGP
jgi:hypothetical protein